MPVEPIKPRDIQKAQAKLPIPDQVIEAFNELIAKDYDSGQATVYQKEVVDLIIEKMYRGLEEDGETKQAFRQKIYEQRWLDVEPRFRQAGWKVEYDKPIGWGGDNYEAHWNFVKKETRGA